MVVALKKGYLSVYATAKQPTEPDKMEINILFVLKQNNNVFNKVKEKL